MWKKFVVVIVYTYYLVTEHIPPRCNTSWKFWRLQDIHNLPKGCGISIAILDTGIDCLHEAVKEVHVLTNESGKYIFGQDSLTPSGYHGTYTAGVATGKHKTYAVKPVEPDSKNKEKCIPLGIAPGAKIVAFNVTQEVKKPSPLGIAPEEETQEVKKPSPLGIAPEEETQEAKKPSPLGIASGAETQEAKKPKYIASKVIKALECIFDYNERNPKECIRIVVMPFRLSKKTGSEEIKKVKKYIDKLFNEQSVVLIAAPGNSGLMEYSGFPANLETVLTVGAVDSYGHLSKISACDKHVDVYALGENVLVPSAPSESETKPTLKHKISPSDLVKISNSSTTPPFSDVKIKARTYFSAPAVAGLVAVLMKCFPGETNNGRLITDLDLLKDVFQYFMIEERFKGIKVLHPYRVKEFFNTFWAKEIHGSKDKIQNNITKLVSLIDLEKNSVK